MQQTQPLLAHATPHTLPVVGSSSSSSSSSARLLKRKTRTTSKDEDNDDDNNNNGDDGIDGKEEEGGVMNSNRRGVSKHVAKVARLGGRKEETRRKEEAKEGIDSASKKILPPPPTATVDAVVPEAPAVAVAAVAAAVPLLSANSIPMAIPVHVPVPLPEAIPVQPIRPVQPVRRDPEGEPNDSDFAFTLKAVDEKNLNPNFVCSVCWEVFHQPVQTTCNHVFCTRCLIPAVKRTPHCPKCRAHVDLKRALPVNESNPALAQILSDVQIYCPRYHGSGCKWEGPVSNMTAHLDTCAFVPVACFHCKDTYLRGDLAQHRNECLRRPIVCEQCRETVPFMAMASHGVDECTQAPIVCASFSVPPDGEVKGCGAMVPRSKLEAHQKIECPKGIVACAYGCPGRFPREAMAKHNAESMLLHNSLLLTRLDRLHVQTEAEISTLKAAMASQQATISELSAMVLPSLMTFGGGDAKDLPLVDVYGWNRHRGWSSLAPLPEPLRHTAAVRIGDVVYVMGGGDSEEVVTNVAYALDLRQGDWKRIADLKYDRWAHTAVGLNGKIYVIGGSHEVAFPDVSNAKERVCGWGDEGEGVGDQKLHRNAHALVGFDWS